MTFKFGIFFKYFMQLFTTFENEPFSVWQYRYYNMALVCKNLFMSAALVLLLGFWQIFAHVILIELRLELFRYTNIHQSKENFMLTGKKRQFLSIIYFLGHVSQIFS